MELIWNFKKPIGATIVTLLGGSVVPLVSRLAFKKVARALRGRGVKSNDYSIGPITIMNACDGAGVVLLGVLRTQE